MREREREGGGRGGGERQVFSWEKEGGGREGREERTRGVVGRRAGVGGEEGCPVFFWRRSIFSRREREGGVVVVVEGEEGGGRGGEEEEGQGGFLGVRGGSVRCVSGVLQEVFLLGRGWEERRGVLGRVGRREEQRRGVSFFGRERGVGVFKGEEGRVREEVQDVCSVFQ